VREILVSDITDKVKELCLKANLTLRLDVLDAVESALKTETSPAGRDVLEQVIKNAGIAAAQRLPICQDTGYVGVFVELGQDVVIRDDKKGKQSADRSAGRNADIYRAIDEGVRRAYSEGSLRKSIVSPPIFDRINTGDNTPALIHIELVEGDTVKLIVMPKGGGTENASQLKMLPVSGDADAVKRFVLEAAGNAAKSCPPVIVGVGIGGSFDKVGLLAKKALLRPLNEPNADPKLADLERELLIAINKLGIGPAGLGGNTTALGVKIEAAPAHIACLPAAVAFNCIAARQAEGIL
jgi:fumarate hydratase subunit alpha